MSENTSTTVDPATLSPAQASERLASLSADKVWSCKVLAGNAEANREFQGLIDAKHKGDRAEAVLAGTAQFEPFETHMGGEISTHNIQLGVASLREIGIDDTVIRAFLQGAPVPQQDRAAVDQLLTRLKGDADWTKKLLSGDIAARQVLTKIMMGRLRPVASES